MKTIRVSDALWKRLKVTCASQGVSMGGVAEAAVRGYLDRLDGVGERLAGESPVARAIRDRTWTGTTADPAVGPAAEGQGEAAIWKAVDRRSEEDLERAVVRSVERAAAPSQRRDSGVPEDEF